MTSTVSRRAFLRLAGSAPVLAATPAGAATRAAPGLADVPTRRTGKFFDTRLLQH